MPIVNGNYVSPTWVNGGPPGLDAAELQAMTNTLQNAAMNTALAAHAGNQSNPHAVTAEQIGAAKIASGSYIGNGQSSVVLTLPFAMKFCVISGYYAYSDFPLFMSNQYYGFMITQNNGAQGPYFLKGKASVDGNTVTFMNQNLSTCGEIMRIINQSNVTYVYTCFG